MFFLKLFAYLALALIGSAAIVFALGQFGFLRGKPPVPLGVQQGKLAPPSPTPNSASSQAGLYPGHPQAAYAAVAPFTPRAGESGPAALQRLADLLLQQTGTHITHQTDGYVRAETTTRWLRFVDDVELWLDPTTQLVHVRSASRLGRKDFGVNRARVEALRAAFLSGPATP
jgi:uncharacterized protein (DUF1499 family)